MPELIWLPEALLDLTEHFEFLKLKNPAAAGRVAQSIRDAGFSLVKNPYRGTLLVDGSDRRKLIIPFGKRGYVLHYYIDGETILILRVYHGRQNRPT